MSLISRKYKEHIDPEKLKMLMSLLDTDELDLSRCERKHNKSKQEIQQQLRASFLTIKKKLKGEFINVTYSYSVPNFGRVYAKKPYCSIGSLPREIRGTLACDYYVDIDITNCHPTLLVQLCDRYKINCSKLRDYVNNRDEYLAKVQSSFDVDRDAAKVLFLELMYGGTFESWCKNYGVSAQVPLWLNEMIECIKGVYSDILSHYPDEIKLLEENGKPEKEYNRDAALISWILQDTERQLLEVMINYLARYGKSVTNCVLCFDGFMMLKDKYDPMLLPSIENEVYKQTNFRIKLSTKGFSTIDIPVEHIKPVSYKAPPTDYFDIGVFVQCSYASFESMKEYFERFNCYCEKGDCIASYNAKIHEVEFLEIGKAGRTRFANLKDHINTNSDGDPTSFFNNWLNCASRKTAYAINFIPYSGTFSLNTWYKEGVINTFRGFNPLIDNYDPSHEAEFDDFYNNYFLKLIHNLAEENDVFAKWVLQFFAQMIQQPDQRPRRAMCFIGTQGDGKNALLDAIKHVISLKLYNSSSKPEDCFGVIASAHAEKLLVNLDESTRKGYYDLEPRVKEFVTKEIINVRKMYMDTFCVNNYARLVSTSNKTQALPIDFQSGDRRFVLFNTTNPFNSVNCKEYIDFFNHYFSVIESDWYPAHMYKKMMSIDISDWNPYVSLDTRQLKKTREMTGTTVDWFIENSIDDIIERAEEAGGKGGPIRIASSELYQMYKDYCSENGIDKPISSKYFKAELEDNIQYKGLIEWHRFTFGRAFELNLGMLYKYRDSLNENCEKDEGEDVTCEF